MKMRIYKYGFSSLLAVVLFATATVAQAAVHKVYPGEWPDGDIQGAIDRASPGDTILVEPGVYTTTAADNPKNARFGLRISTDNLRLIGKVKKGRGEDGKVRILPSPGQQTGVYAAPAECSPEEGVGDEFCENNRLQGFYIRGFTVMDFDWNGIQTRFVNDFKIIRNEVGNVEINGIYPTISANGLVQNNVAYGTKDTAMWVAASENVRVIGNDLSMSPIGLEVNVSVDIEVMHNDIHDNTVGVALFHPNSAGNDPRPDMGNWVVRQNNVYDNNLDNPADPGSFQGGLPKGVGILLLGVSNNVVEKNTVEGNEFVGIGVLGWCSATQAIPGRDCYSNPPEFDPDGDGGDDPIFLDPSVSNNLISQNKLRGNGGTPPGDGEGGPGPLDFLSADLTYFSTPDLPNPGTSASFENSSGNCFKKNKPRDYSFSAYDTYPFEPFNGVPGELPTDGC
jgi:hypothetical protein